MKSAPEPVGVRSQGSHEASGSVWPGKNSKKRPRADSLVQEPDKASAWRMMSEKSQELARLRSKAARVAQGKGGQAERRAKQLERQANIIEPQLRGRRVQLTAAEAGRDKKRSPPREQVGRACRVGPP